MRRAQATDHAAVARLWQEYAAEFRANLGPQDLDREARLLPAPYDVPGNGLWVAERRGQVVGCAALKRLEQPEASRAGSTVELKRMVVAAGARGRGVGRALVLHLVAEAQKAGYRRIVLDTTPGMEAARKLYSSAGFQECPAYYATSPLVEPVYYEMHLSPPGLGGEGPDPAG